MATAEPASGLRAGESASEAVPHRSYLKYRDAFYLKVAAALCVAAVVLYLAVEPPHGRGGGTWVGYVLGTLSAGLMVWLAWFGVRKRQFRDGIGTAQAWLSAHVYLGAALVVLASLHSAFELGWNLASLAYLLLWGVVLSGAYGVWAYAALPARITAIRQQMGPKVMLQEIENLNASALRLAERIDEQTREIVARSVSRVRIGGGVVEQLTGRYRKPADDTALAEFLKKKKGQLAAEALAGKALAAVQPANASQTGRRLATLAFVTDKLFDSGRDPRAEGLKNLLETLARRNALVERLNRDITLRARLTVWQYLHVPLACTLLVAVAAHVLSVFVYR